jgi:hypothetical protein
VVGVAACSGVCGDAVEQVAVAEQVEYAVERGGVEFSCGDAVAVAGVGALALAGVAGVVAVAVVAAVCAHADVAFAAVAAHDESA